MVGGRFMHVPLVAAVLMIGGCDSTIRPINVGPGCPSKPLRDPEQWSFEPSTQLIDDFETGDLLVARAEGRDGAWYLSKDGTGAVSSAGISSRCVGSGEASGHLVTSASSEWGAMWTGAFRAVVAGVAQPYDGSKYGGISFWAGFDSANGPAFPIRVGVVTIDTAWNGGVCTNFCMDFHGIEVTPGLQWQRFSIRFSDLRQQGWGNIQEPLRLDQLVGFVVWPNRRADFWIDDLRFEP